MLKLVVLLFFAGLGVVLYQHRQMFEPAAIWYEVWNNGGLKKTEPLPTVRGVADVVLDSRSFHLQRPKMPPFALRLTGLDEPITAPATVEQAKLEAGRKKVLQGLIQGEMVHVEVSYHSGNSGLGICYKGKTNVNLYLIEHGCAELKPEYIKTLPAKLQYEFFASRRMASRKNPDQLSAMSSNQ
jgi:hypothetical protein